MPGGKLAFLADLNYCHHMLLMQNTLTTLVCCGLPRVWLCNTGAVLQASIPVYPQEDIGRQLEYLAVELADVRQYLQAFDVMSCFGQSFVVQHPNDLQRSTPEGCCSIRDGSWSLINTT